MVSRTERRRLRRLASSSKPVFIVPDDGLVSKVAYAGKVMVRAAAESDGYGVEGVHENDLKGFHRLAIIRAKRGTLSGRRSVEPF